MEGFEKGDREMIKNIIFDWSGTISDDFKPVYEAIMIVMEKMISKNISKEEFRKEFELPPLKFWQKYIPNIDLDEEHKLFLDAIHKVDPPTIYPTIKEVLENLKSKELKLFVISSHPHEKLMIEAVGYGITDLFDEIRGGIYDKVKSIEDITTKNKLTKNETAYVGDMIYDIEAGKEVGVKTVAVTYGYQDKDKLATMNPDYIVSSPEKLINIINNNI